MQDEYLWTKGTDFKLKFPLQQFGVGHTADQAVSEAAAASNASSAAGLRSKGQSDQPAPRRWLPAELSTPELRAALEGYEGVSLSGAVPATSGSGAPHAGAKLPAG